jgi:hypothetical protein
VPQIVISALTRTSGINSRRKRIVTILGDDDVSPPGGGLPEVSSLNLANGPVERERHPVARDGWVENYVWVREVPVHTIQGFYKLQVTQHYETREFSGPNEHDIAMLESQSRRHNPYGPRDEASELVVSPVGLGSILAWD